MMMKLRLSLLVLALAALLSKTDAFVPSRAALAQVAVSTTTPTTLFYRDDVPPIGSSPHWETPNDFNQFLTQCSIQSFLFLLHSLSDVHTMQWLHDFTDPVLLEQSDLQKTEPGKAQKPKVSLQQAAQSALQDIAKELGTTVPVAPPAVLLEEEIEIVTPTGEEETKKTFQPSLACLTMLQDKAAVKKAFSHHTVGMFLAARKKLKLQEEKKKEKSLPTPPEPEPPVSNTGISQLYSSVPTNKGIRTSVKPSSFSPSQASWKQGGNKWKPVNQTPKKTNWAPSRASWKQQSNSNNKDAPASTSIPFPFPSSKKTTQSWAAAKPKGGSSSSSVPTTGSNSNDDSKSHTAAAAADDNNEQDAGDWKTFPKTNPVSLKYHGLAILNRTRFPTWESYFEELLEQPKESFLVESWNPAQVPDYEMDIDPASLVRRMLSVRMQIAQEFEHDLQVIADMGGMTLKSYHKMLREIREQRAEEELQQQKDALEKQIPKSMEDSLKNQHKDAAATDNDVEDTTTTPNDKSRRMQRANLLFLDSAVGAAADSGVAPSPLRKGNFDLLCLLATQEAIHRVLNDPSRQARSAPEHGTKKFLQDFYVTRLLSHFTGDQPWGRSDDFLEELLESPPRMITVGSSGDDKDKDESEDENNDALTRDLTYLIDPVKVAEIILNEREMVALEWKQQLGEQTKEEHMALQRMVLARVMGQTVEECEIVDPEGNDMEGDEDDEFGSCFE